jgi:hypothetical protein
VSFFAPAASNLWKQIESYKIDPEPLFREAGIDPAVLFDQSARIPLDHSGLPGWQAPRSEQPSHG